VIPERKPNTTQNFLARTNTSGKIEESKYATPAIAATYSK
jgi:hypothetical protein